MPLGQDQFTLDMIELDAVQQFVCGTDECHLQVSEWIKGRPEGDSVREAIEQRNTKVWLYFNEEENFVGYGSLGPTTWKYPGPRDKQLLTCIPMLGVHSGYHRRGYGREILRDLRSKAEVAKQERPILGLCVHPENLAAIQLYTSEGFAFQDRRNGMNRMILRL